MRGFGGRSALLREYAAVTGDAPEALQRVVELAAYLSGWRSAAVHLARELHRVAAVGAPLGPSPAGTAMCRQVVETGERITTPDATGEARFAGNPWVTGDDPVRAYSSHPLTTPEGEVLGTLCVFDGVPHALDQEQVRMLDHLAAQVMQALELSRVAKQLAHSATHDALTGLPNRVLLSDRVEQALAQRDASGLVLAVIDLDGFKEVNDTYGHAAGDAVLVAVAERLPPVLRIGDTVARVGGDEFVLLLPHGEPEVKDLRERVEAALAEPVVHDGAELRVRASIGVTRGLPMDDVSSLLRRADEAMYAVKGDRRP